LLNQVDFSKLKDFPESDRFSFYEALADSIPPGGRGVEGGIQILGEGDADQRSRSNYPHVRYAGTA